VLVEVTDRNPCETEADASFIMRQKLALEPQYRSDARLVARSLDSFDGVIASSRFRSDSDCCQQQPRSPSRPKDKADRKRSDRSELVEPLRVINKNLA
jgi:hypothetical protein